MASEPDAVSTEPDAPTPAAPAPGAPTPESPGLSQRVKATVATARDRADETYKRVEASRPDHPTVDIAFTTVERDFERGGGLIAGALAYRFFFWLLPFVLVLVGGLGFLSASSDTAPQDLAKQAGFLGLTAKSIADASQNAERTRFYALAIGLPALYLTSIGFVKALMVAHSLMWGVPRKKVQRKPLAAVVMTGVLVGAMVLLAIESRVRQNAKGPGFAVVLLFIVAAAALWLLVSWFLPHADGVKVRNLIPGCLLVAAGIQGVHVITVYYISRKLAHSSSTYGTLGAATAILLALFLIARVIVFGVSLNAEMWRRHQLRVARTADTPVTQQVEGSAPQPPPP